DARRDAWFKSQGFQTMRFWNHEVLENAEGVAETILCAVRQRPGLSPPP
ncbi:MAG TPA: DUF559 domain-containing protein, partial [Alphaproteobacteria bacterium]|nr:DUF559 domain-containing protein [Alphaproteobacteria bacterium]